MATSRMIDRAMASHAAPSSGFSEADQAVLAMPPEDAAVVQAQRELAALALRKLADHLGAVDDYRDIVDALGIAEYRIMGATKGLGDRAWCSRCSRHLAADKMAPSRSWPHGKQYWCLVCRREVIAAAWPRLATDAASKGITSVEAAS